MTIGTTVPGPAMPGRDLLAIEIHLSDRLEGSEHHDGTAADHFNQSHDRQPEETQGSPTQMTATPYHKTDEKMEHNAVKTPKSTIQITIDPPTGTKDNAEPATGSQDDRKWQRKVAVEFLKKRTKERQADKDVEEGIRQQGEHWTAVVETSRREFDKSRGLT